MLNGSDPTVRVVEAGGNVYLSLALGPDLKKASSQFVTTDLLGKARVSGLAYENSDGSPVVIDTDYFGKKRSGAEPSAGPFENPGSGTLKLKVW
jgi:alpha-N-arabinofuranosidase